MKKVLMFLLAFVSIQSYGQQCDVLTGDDSSGRDTPTSCDYNATNTEKYCMNLYFHIVRDDNQTNGFTGSLATIESNLNTYFNSHGIYFSSIGFDYINSTALNDVSNSTEFYALTNTNVVSNAINIYLVNNMYAAGVARLNNFRCVVKNNATANAVPAHEVGHCLNLQHTFHGTEAGGCAETPSNCLICGDFVCDTVGDSDLTNIMSYYASTNHFTAGQGLRMRNSIKCHRTAQRTNLCATITGANTICSTGNQVYTLNDIVPGSSATWSVTSNLQIISSTSTTVTIQSINAAVNGVATITANVGGATIIKDIFIGKPMFTTTKTQIYMQNFVEIKMVGTNGSNINNQGITNVIWETLSSNPTGCGEVFNTSNFVGYEDYYGNCNTQFKITATNACGTTIYTSTVSGVGAGAHKSSSDLSYNVYPNSSDHFVNVELRESGTSPAHNAKIKADLFDMFGQCKASVEVTNNKASIDVSALNPGIYLLKVNTDGQIETHRVIVK